MSNDLWKDHIAVVEQITYKPGWFIRHGIETDRMWLQIGVTAEADVMETYKNSLAQR